MNLLFKLYCRTFQKIMKLCFYLMPCRTPYCIKGENSILKLPSLLVERKIKKILIVTDSKLESLGLINPLRDELGKMNIKYFTFAKVLPNPTIDIIEEGLKVYLENQCEALVAFGGGSPIDCAKIIGARVVRPKKTVTSMRGLLKIRRRIPLLCAIPTTAGTGSEATLAAVVTNSLTLEKYPINDHSLIPHIAIFDPILTTRLPKQLTSTTGMDALTHAIEAFIGNSNTSKTKKQATKAVELIMNNLIKAYDNPLDIEARSNMQEASYLAGMAFTRAYVGYVHAIAHAVSGQYNAPHGLANAIILPHVLKAYGKSVHSSLSSLAVATKIGNTANSDADNSKAFIDTIVEMNKYMLIPYKLDCIKREDIDKMIKRALAEANPLYPVPKIWGVAEMKHIFDLISSSKNIH